MCGREQLKERHKKHCGATFKDDDDDDDDNSPLCMFGCKTTCRESNDYNYLRVLKERRKCHQENSLAENARKSIKQGLCWPFFLKIFI